ncbi:MAG: hypothetical protein R3B96_10480 [Pirellulaceae bacterium]
MVVGVLARLFDAERLLDALVDLAILRESRKTRARSLNALDWVPSAMTWSISEREAAEALYARIPRDEMRAVFA